MKILQYRSENFKRISVVEITPTGNLVQITGKNGAGKSSVLDGIFTTLVGSEYLQSVPIRKGQDKAVNQLTLGDGQPELIVTRTLRRRKEGEGFTNTLTVENADGMRAPSPQAMLDKLMGRITMDPLAFTREKTKAQFDIMRAFVPGVDFDDIASANDADFKKRTDVNRDAKRFRAAAEAVQVPDSIDADTEVMDEAALTEELAGAGKHNASIETRKERRAAVQKEIDAGPAVLASLEKNTNDVIKASQDRAASDVADVEATIARLEEEIAMLRGKITALNKNAENQQNQRAVAGSIAYGDASKHIVSLQEMLDSAEPLPEPIDTEALAARIATARWTNAAIRARDEKAKHAAEADRLEAEAKALTDAMLAREKTKADAIAKAELPVEGLGFGDGVVTIDGLPFDQASDAQQLRTSIAIAIATAGKLRVIRVRDGSLLDDDGMKLLAEMADKADMQIWIESVQHGDKVGFVLEDGHLQGVEVPPDEIKEEGKLL